MFEKLGVVCSGVEPEQTGRELASNIFAKKKLSIEIFSDLNEVGNNSQDIVICTEVIENVEDTAGLLQGIYRVLKPGGRFVLSTPIKIFEMPLDTEHVREFFPGELSNLVSSCFRVTDHRIEIPVFGVELYYWRPLIFLRLPIIKYLMNILSAYFGYSVMRKSGRRFPILQIMTTIKG